MLARSAESHDTLEESMKAFSFAALLLLCSAALALPSAFRAAPSDDVTRENDIAYATVNGTSLALDMARPSKGDGPFPAVVVIHGGAWREGNKASNRPLLAKYAAHGYVAISPQYRFCPKDPFPAQVHDVKAAVRWLRTHHEQYKIDVDHIGAAGFSAGGHLALMLGVTAPADGLEGDVAEGAPSSRVQAVVNYFGPTDLVVEGLPTEIDVLLRDFLGGEVSQRMDTARRASPITFVTKDDPPILTFQGTADTMVSVKNAIELSEAQTREHVAGRVELIVGGGHGDWSKEDWARTESEAMDFFDRWLKPAKK
jgi:acetyl esterase/lipase